METEIPHVIIRSGVDRDWPLLCTSFATYYCKNPYSKYGFKVPPHTLMTKLEQFRTAPNWKLITACPSTNHDEVMGMLLYRDDASIPPAVAWITVKPIYQHKGVAKALIKHSGIPKGEIDCAFYLSTVTNRKGTPTDKFFEPLGNIKDWAAKLGFRLNFKPYLPDVELWNELNRDPSITPIKR